MERKIIEHLNTKRKQQITLQQCFNLITNSPKDKLRFLGEIKNFKYLEKGYYFSENMIVTYFTLEE